MRIDRILKNYLDHHLKINGKFPSFLILENFNSIIEFCNSCKQKCNLWASYKNYRSTEKTDKKIKYESHKSQN